MQRSLEAFVEFVNSPQLATGIRKCTPQPDSQCVHRLFSLDWYFCVFSHSKRAKGVFFFSGFYPNTEIVGLL